MSGRQPQILPITFTNQSSPTSSQALVRFYQTLSKQLNNMKVVGGGGRFVIRGDAIELYLDNTTNPNSNEFNSFKLTKFDNTTFKATIASGYIVSGETYVKIDQTDVLVTGGTSENPHFIYVEYDPSTNIGIIPTTATATYMTSTDNKLRKVLYSVFKSNNQLFLKARHHFGDVTFGGALV